MPPGPVTIQNEIPYWEGNTVANNIKQECPINRQLADFIKQYSAESGLDVRGTNDLDTGGAGNVLKIEITSAISEGNAFIGHRKSTTIRGQLYDNGNLLATFTGARISGGGAWAGFKGSCSVLGRTVEVLGKDVAAWLTQPTDNAHLGD
jgi:hypothetical protein